ncbi:MAG: hypothetical protein QM742_11280 [Aquabacterium sp.]
MACAHWASANGVTAASTLTPMDDAALMAVHGAGMDPNALQGIVTGRQVGDDRRDAPRRPDAPAPALLAALALQARMAPMLASQSVLMVSASALPGGSVASLTPVTAMGPIVGMPLFGLVRGVSTAPRQATH